MENRFLFRAKRVDNGIWVYGLPSYKQGGKIGEIEVWDGADTTFYAVDPSTICQCTAMPDKNKKLVFEHDIVWDSDERRFYEIIWDQEDMCWHVKDADGYKSNFEECYGSTIEVNGNSFDNPELLEV